MVIVKWYLHFFVQLVIENRIGRKLCAKLYSLDLTPFFWFESVYRSKFALHSSLMNHHCLGMVSTGFKPNLSEHIDCGD